jgi:hypothetical protein
VKVTEMTNEFELTPSPSRLVESLRDTGYTYQAAFADIVDNSIAAGASHIEVDIEESIFSNDVTVSFFDNGAGMSEENLINAMRYGSERRPSPKSLGKFGMGLKTASTAFCKKLTVISKQNDAIFARCWDINEIKKQDKWLLITPSISEYAAQIDKLKNIASGGSGTVVIWEDVDRLVTNSGSDYGAQAIAFLKKEIKDHLSATFGKFLIGRESFKTNQSSAASEPDISLSINGERLSGWDPTGKFLNTPEEPDRVLIEQKVHKVMLSGGRSAKFELNGYVLPNKNKMTEAEIQAVRFSNDNQGFYIYREDRLIIGGGWPHRLFSQDSHTNLLRVELNFDHELDDYFEIDIRKSKVNFPIKIRTTLKEALAPWRNQAQSRYRTNKPESPVTGESTSDISTNHQISSRAIQVQQVNTGKVEILNFDKNSSVIRIKNRFGEVEINRAAVVHGTNVFVTTSPSLEGGMLWEIDITEDNSTVVILNEEHEFYRRFYQSTEITPVLIQAMDSLFWALANSELKSVSDLAKRNFEELRFSLSNSLRFLANELPNVE